MAQTTISLARLVELKVPIVWQEAVEIVRALEGASLSQGTLITLEDALISTDGTVILAPPGPAHDVWLSPLRLLDRLLDGVSMPPELRSLIGSDADALSSFPSEGESPKKSVTLDWFSRPDGASLIGRLAARGIAAYTATGSTASAPAAEVSTVLPTPVADYWPPGAFALPSPAFAPKPRQPEPTTAPSPSPLAREAPPVVPVEASPRRLAPKTSLAPLAVEASRSPLAKGVASLQTALSPTANSLLEQLRHKLNQLPFPELRERVSGVIRLRENLPEGFTGVIAAAGGATLLMVVTAWAWLPARAEVPTIAARGPVLVGSAVVNFAVPVANVTPSAYLALTRSVATAAAVAAPPSRDRDVVATMGSSPASAPAASDTSLALLFNGLPAPPTPAPAVRATSQPSSAAPSMSAGRPAAAAPVDRRIYSAADENVAPPSMRRLQMPSEPKPGEVTGDSWIEVLVDERGQVAQVRLHSSNLSLNDRMIVSAAKAWQFEPALKDGNPVKYVLRMPILR